jgi:hypothetical protein
MGVSPVGVNGYTDRPDNMPVASQVARLNDCVSVETSVETIDGHNVDTEPHQRLGFTIWSRKVCVGGVVRAQWWLRTRCEPSLRTDERACHSAGGSQAWPPLEAIC